MEHAEYLAAKDLLRCGQDDFSHARLQIHHDKDAEVYLNGVPAFSGKGYLVDYALFDIAPEALASLHPGRNTIAVHCRQTAGGQFIDVGILVPEHAPFPAPPDAGSPLKPLYAT